MNIEHKKVASRVSNDITPFNAGDAVPATINADK